MSESLAAIARELAETGKKHNRHLANQFNDDWERLQISDIPNIEQVSEQHLLFFQSISESLSWLQDEGQNRPNLLKGYLRILVECSVNGNHLDPRTIEDKLKETLNIGDSADNNKAPKRLTAVTSGLSTWTQVILPGVQRDQQLNLEEIQGLVMNVNNGIKWSSLAAIKMYAILHDGNSNKGKIILSRSLYPPMGRRVSRGIEHLFGFSLGESKSDHTISKDLHLKLAEVTGESVFDLNSGFYKEGGGS